MAAHRRVFQIETYAGANVRSVRRSVQLREAVRECRRYFHADVKAIGGECEAHVLDENGAVVFYIGSQPMEGGGLEVTESYTLPGKQNGEK